LKNSLFEQCHPRKINDLLCDDQISIINNPEVGLAAAVSALMLVAVPALFRTWFGREFLIGAARCEVATDSVPDSTPSRIITLETPYYRPFPWVQAEQARSSTSTMHHEIYNYPGCVLEIVKWVNEHFDSRPQVR